MADEQKIPRILDEVTDSIVKRWQKSKDGGLALHLDGNVSSVQATAVAQLWLQRYNPKGFLEQKTKGLTFLVNAQNKPDGGWGVQADRPSDPISTGMALFAFVRFTIWTQKSESELKTRHNYTDAMRNGVEWLKRHVKSDAWSLAPGQMHPSAHATYWACSALRESQHVDLLDDPEVNTIIVPEALARVEKSIHDGGWGEIFTRRPEPLATAYCTYLLLKYSLDLQSAAAQDGMSWLIENYHKGAASGAWPPVETTARIIIALLAGGQDPQSPQIAQGIQYLLEHYQAPGGWRADPDSEPDLRSTHSACRALLDYSQRIISTAPPQIQAPSGDIGFGRVDEGSQGSESIAVDGKTPRRG